MERRRRERKGAGPTVAVLADVARRAGLSTASVSRALNFPDQVRPKTRARVLAAVEELGYVPHGAARALASRRLRTMGALVPTLDNAIFASAISALQRRLGQRGFNLLVASSGYRLDEESRAAQAMVEHGVDGLMLIGAEHEPALYRLLGRKRVPYVNTWAHDAGSAHPSIGFDNATAAGRVADYLVDIGHRSIAMIAGITHDNDRARARVAGVRSALESRGLPLPAEYLLERRYDIGLGREALRQLLLERRPPTAVICGNDVLAIGVLLEAQAQGIDVPRRLSITGFDDLPIATHLVPALTTVRVPATEMGNLAAEYLMARVEGAARPAQMQELEALLVVRGTTAPPAAGP